MHQACILLFDTVVPSSTVEMKFVNMTYSHVEKLDRKKRPRLSTINGGFAVLGYAYSSTLGLEHNFRVYNDYLPLKEKDILGKDWLMHSKAFIDSPKEVITLAESDNNKLKLKFNIDSKILRTGSCRFNKLTIEKPDKHFIFFEEKIF